MSGTTPGPLPTEHIFLHEIAKQPAGSKVRFLGCVVSYDISTGTLLLEHAFPTHTPQTSPAKVDISLILESIKADLLQPGTWLNIIGYVNRAASRRKRPALSGGISGQMERSRVQALLAWNAGPVRVADYESILMQQRDMARR